MKLSAIRIFIVAMIGVALHRVWVVPLPIAIFGTLGCLYAGAWLALRTREA